LFAYIQVNELNYWKKISKSYCAENNTPPACQQMLNGQHMLKRLAADENFAYSTVSHAFPYNLFNCCSYKSPSVKMSGLKVIADQYK